MGERPLGEFQLHYRVLFSVNEIASGRHPKELGSGGLRLEFWFKMPGGKVPPPLPPVTGWCFSGAHFAVASPRLLFMVPTTLLRTLPRPKW